MRGHHSSEMKTVSVAERPDLVARAWEEAISTIPEHTDHGDECVLGPTD